MLNHPAVTKLWHHTRPQKTVCTAVLRSVVLSTDAIIDDRQARCLCMKWRTRGLAGWIERSGERREVKPNKVSSNGWVVVRPPYIFCCSKNSKVNWVMAFCTHVKLGHSGGKSK